MFAIEGNTLTIDDLQSILRIHSLKELKRRVESEVKWFSENTQTIVHNGTVIVDESLVNQVLFNGTDKHCVKRETPYLLYSDVSNLAGKRWINLVLIETFVSLINLRQSWNKVITLNTIMDIPDDT